MIKILFLSASVLMMSYRLYSQDIVGKWKTVDDESGRIRSIVEIFETDNKYYGKIQEVFPLPGKDPDPICIYCKGKKKDQRVIGMSIIEDMEKNGDYYDSGTILDPEDGNVYDCKIWLDKGNLKLRGYKYLFYRTQIWMPYDE